MLVVLDDGNHGENADDASRIRDMLVAHGYTANLITEQTGGNTASDVAGYDVVWFSNPGYPFDDARSVDTLLDFLSNGGGVVAQGDDITYSLGNGFNASVERLTHLKFSDNGVTACGHPTDNDVGMNFDVTLGAETFDGLLHPMLTNLAGTSFIYGNDIDLSSADRYRRAGARPRDAPRCELQRGPPDGDRVCATTGGRRRPAVEDSRIVRR